MIFCRSLRSCYFFLLFLLFAFLCGLLLCLSSVFPAYQSPSKEIDALQPKEGEKNERKKNLFNGIGVTHSYSHMEQQNA